MKIDLDIKKSEIPARVSDAEIRYMIKHYLWGYKSIKEYKSWWGNEMAPIGGRKNENNK